ncbi:hypothetical protein BCR39DRAFT_226994 [Naematelia encephala]|uniref:PIN domain-containing protein n=1 Tax=Naematelia encephala TaxID=71784 RepID=A0A1Y2AY05_9TREE|nr:hypothetical protein BCR39DRAFT_226994 [Naematelia encephala]
MRDIGNAVEDEQRARLQKALSQAYLSHQISQLEHKVNAISIPQNQPEPSQQQGDRVIRKLGRIDDSHHDDEEDSDAFKFDDENEREHEEREWRVSVLDVSALLWAPKAVRRLVGLGGEVIISLEGMFIFSSSMSTCSFSLRQRSLARTRFCNFHLLVLASVMIIIRSRFLNYHLLLSTFTLDPYNVHVLTLSAIHTLDLLKKGDHPSATQARSAARYIEHATRHHRLLSSDPSITVQTGTNYKRGSGMRIQRADECLEPSSVALVPLPGELPRWISNVLACAAYFERIARVEDAEALTAVLCVANPPLSVPPGEEGSHVERGEGALISEQAERFELGVEVLRDEDEEIGRGFGGRDRAAARGRGRGRGGGGGRGRVAGHSAGRGAGKGTRQKEEPEREVKILLRRPQSDTERVASGSPNTETSPLPAVALPTEINASPRLVLASPRLPPSPKIRPPPPPPAPGEPRLFDPNSGHFQGPPGEHMHPSLHQHHHSHNQRPPSDGIHPHPPPPARDGMPPPRGYGRGGRGGERGRGGRGRGRGGSTGGGGPRNGEFVLLQRPGPPADPQILTPRARPPPPPAPTAAVPDSPRRMILLQRPK